eukprot:GEMP01085614.1.p1 GENE.GEMP01085614.1~~GEMP01085614.1.p1  ORF type:complete len:297 (+),score=71.76 GEMP01085614.1:18-908(+)
MEASAMSIHAYILGLEESIKTQKGRIQRVEKLNHHLTAVNKKRDLIIQGLLRKTSHVKGKRQTAQAAIEDERAEERETLGGWNIEQRSPRRRTDFMSRTSSQTVITASTLPSLVDNHEDVAANLAIRQQVLYDALLTCCAPMTVEETLCQVCKALPQVVRCVTVQCSDEAPSGVGLFREKYNESMVFKLPNTYCICKHPQTGFTKEDEVFGEAMCRCLDGIIQGRAEFEKQKRLLELSTTAVIDCVAYLAFAETLTEFHHLLESRLGTLFSTHVLKCRDGTPRSLRNIRVSSLPKT